MKDSSSGANWLTLTKQWYGSYLGQSSPGFVTPFSLRVTNNVGRVLTFTNAITSIVPATNHFTGVDFGIDLFQHTGTNKWWFALDILGSASLVRYLQMKDSSSGSNWIFMSYQSYGSWLAQSSNGFVTPLSFKLTSSTGAVLTFTNAIKTISASTHQYTGVDFATLRAGDNVTDVEFVDAATGGAGDEIYDGSSGNTDDTSSDIPDSSSTAAMTGGSDTRTPVKGNVNGAGQVATSSVVSVIFMVMLPLFMTIF
jgi:hypothetical protein